MSGGYNKEMGELENVAFGEVHGLGSDDNEDRRPDGEDNDNIGGRNEEQEESEEDAEFEDDHPWTRRTSRSSMKSMG